MYRDNAHVQNLGTAVLVLSAASFGLGVVANLASYGRRAFGGFEGGILGAFLAPLVIVMVVFFMLWHYHNWDLLDEDLRKTTPGKAVGYLFIPFYNFYWIFVSFIWLWQGLNEMGKRYAQDTWQEMPQGIPIAFAILCLLGAIPFVGIASGVLSILLIVTTNNRVRELYEAAGPTKGKPEASAGQPEVTEQ